MTKKTLNERIEDKLNEIFNSANEEDLKEAQDFLANESAVSALVTQLSNGTIAFGQVYGKPAASSGQLTAGLKAFAKNNVAAAPNRMAQNEPGSYISGSEKLIYDIASENAAIEFARTIPEWSEKAIKALGRGVAMNGKIVVFSPAACLILMVSHGKLAGLKKQEGLPKFFKSFASDFLGVEGRRLLFAMAGKVKMAHLAKWVEEMKEEIKPAAALAIRKADMPAQTLYVDASLLQVRGTGAGMAAVNLDTREAVLEYLNFSLPISTLEAMATAMAYREFSKVAPVVEILTDNRDVVRMLEEGKKVAGRGTGIKQFGAEAFTAPYYTLRDIIFTRQRVAPKVTWTRRDENILADGLARMCVDRKISGKFTILPETFENIKDISLEGKHWQIWLKVLPASEQPAEMQDNAASLSPDQLFTQAQAQLKGKKRGILAQLEELSVSLASLENQQETLDKAMRIIRLSTAPESRLNMRQAS